MYISFLKNKLKKLKIYVNNNNNKLETYHF
jgi:hypothetical protein